jgi:hypothetical protein
MDNLYVPSAEIPSWYSPFWGMKRKIFTSIAEAFSLLEPKTNVEVLPNPGKPDIPRSIPQVFLPDAPEKLFLGYNYLHQTL